MVFVAISVFSWENRVIVKYCAKFIRFSPHVRVAKIAVEELEENYERSVRIRRARRSGSTCQAWGCRIAPNRRYRIGL